LNSIITFFNGNKYGFQHSKKKSTGFSKKKVAITKSHWSTDEVLFLQRFTMSDVKNYLAKSNMHFIGRIRTGLFFCLMVFDMLLEKVMRYIVIGQILGKLDKSFKRIYSFFLPIILFNFIVKNTQLINSINLFLVQGT